MSTMNLRILRLGDEPPFYGLAEEREVIHLAHEPWQVVILEAGMTSGAPSIALRLDLPDGRTVLAETSLAAWIATTAAARGAFPGAFAGGPFAVQR